MATTAKLDLPIAARDRAWDAGGADSRVRSWAGGDDKNKIDWGKYARAFFWHDSADAKSFGSYKLGYADIIDGELTAVPRGIFAVAAVLQGSRGGVDIPAADKASIKSTVSKWYAAMRAKFNDDSITPPWEGKSERCECRFIDADVEVRQAEGEPQKIVGHAAVFDTLTTLYAGVQEKVAKGAFLDSIQRDDIRALFNHDPNFVLGRNMAKTLNLKEDSQGLYFEITLPDTQAARDLVTSIKRGDISQNSFAFRVMPGGQDWTESPDGSMKIRTLTKVKLFDVSPVTYPAYPTTDLGLRSIEEILEDAPAEEKKTGRSVDLARKKLVLYEKSLDIFI